MVSRTFGLRDEAICCALCFVMLPLRSAPWCSPSFADVVHTPSWSCCCCSAYLFAFPATVVVHTLFVFPATVVLPTPLCSYCCCSAYLFVFPATIVVCAPVCSYCCCSACIPLFVFPTIVVRTFLCSLPLLLCVLLCALCCASGSCWQKEKK